MKKQKPLASIIMPCWNSGRYLKESVASALGQTYAPLELVIADDGSDDEETQRILASLKDPRIRVLHLLHGGPSAARNAAIRAAKGTYILPLDSDDLIEPPYLAEAIEILECDHTVGMVYAQADYCGARTGKWQLVPYSMETMLCESMIYVSAVFRKADFERVGGYDETLPYYEDWDFWLSILELGLHPVRLGGTYFHYRKRADSTSLMQQRYALEEIFGVYDRIVERHQQLYTAQVRLFARGMRKRAMQQKGRIERLQERLLRLQTGGDGNRWAALGQQMPWAELERRYAPLFVELGGAPHPAQLAIGIVLAQAEMGVSDEEMLRQLEETPSLRRFTGLDDGPLQFPPGFMEYLHGKLTEDVMQEIAALLRGGA